jgi:hypothetical protein
MADPSASPTLSPERAAQLAEFARACKAAARAVSLYPSGHPAIESTLTRLAQVTASLTERGPFRVHVRSDRLLIEGAQMSRPDLAVSELAALLHRHLIGVLTLSASVGPDSWRTLLLLLARPPEDVRAHGGIARLWAGAGVPGAEIQEIDYAELLREKQGVARAADEIITAAMAGPHIELDDSGMQRLVELMGDPSKLDVLVTQLEQTAGSQGSETSAAAFLSIACGLAEHVSQTDPSQLATVFQRMGHAARKLSADTILSLIGRRGQPEAIAGGVNVISSITNAMSDESLTEFVAGSVIAERGASARLAHAFSALVPEIDRRRQLLALAQEEVASELGQEDGYTELWQRVEEMLTSYSDESYVFEEYAQELSNVRAHAVDVERTGEDPPDRIVGWLSTVTDDALRGYDRALLADLLAIETDPLRWRDVAEIAMGHADELAGAGCFSEGCQLVEAIIEQGFHRGDRHTHAAAALERFGRGSMMKHVAAHLREADDEDYERVKRLWHALGPSAVAALGQVLSVEQDARSRRRLRDILLGFGSEGREAVRQLMNAPNWEVRRTAAYLLREFGGAEALNELIPLLTDAEPLVQREAVHGLVASGSSEAAQILLAALTTVTGRARETLMNTLFGMREDRATALFCHLVRRVNRRALPQVYAAAIEALGSARTTDAIDALKFALHQSDWRSPFRTRRLRTAAAQSLRRIGTPAALDALREIASRGPRGARAAARTELARVE